MRNSYSFNVSDQLESEGTSDLERLVQTVRAEVYDNTPLIAVHGGSFGSQTQLAVKKVSSANLQAMLRISQTNLAKMGTRGQQELAALRQDPAEELARMMREEGGRDKVTAPLAIAITLALVSQFLNGYNTAVLNAVSQVVFPGHSTTEWAVAVGAFAIGGPLGSMVAGQLADSWGRRHAMLFCTYSFAAGGLLLTFSPNIICLALARTILGFSSGFSSVLVPIYMGELAPPSMRGFFGTCTQTSLVCGILAAALIAFPLGNAAGWRWMMALTPLLCLLQLLLAPFLHESPRWLLQRNPHSAQAALSLKQLYGLKTDQEVDLEISHILNASMKASSHTSMDHLLGAGGGPSASPGPRPNPEAAQMRMAAIQGAASMAEGTMPLKGERPVDMLPTPQQQQQHAAKGNENSGESVSSMLRDRSVRPLVAVAVVLHLCQQFCGINAVFYYSTDFFRGVIDDPLMGSVLVCGINVVATLAATVLMDQIGRRTLMIVSISGMIVSTALVVSALLGILPNFVALFAVMSFVSFFEIGLGPIPWLIVAEMFEPNYVASAQSLACQVNWMSNFIVGVGFPFMQQALGPMSFLPFGVVLLGCLAFVSARMPETHGATLADVRYQVKVMWGIFDDLFKTQNLSGDNSVSLERSLAVYKQRVARRSGSNSSLESGASSTDGGPIML